MSKKLVYYSNGNDLAKQQKKDSRNLPTTGNRKTVSALVIFDESKQRVMLEIKKSLKYGSLVFKLPQIKTPYGRYSLTNLQKKTVTKYLGEQFDQNKIVNSIIYEVSDLFFLALFIPLESAANCINGSFSFRQISDLNEGYKKLPVKGGGKAIILPSLVYAVKNIPNLELKKLKTA